MQAGGGLGGWEASGRPTCSGVGIGEGSQEAHARAVGQPHARLGEQQHACKGRGCRRGDAGLAAGAKSILRS